MKWVVLGRGATSNFLGHEVGLVDIGLVLVGAAARRTGDEGDRDDVRAEHDTAVHRRAVESGLRRCAAIASVLDANQS